MRTLCYSVRLESLTLISEKCYKAKCFDGSSDLIPASQVFGPDYTVQKSDAYWISAWILEKKNIQYSRKKSAWFDDSGNILPSLKIQHHEPKKLEPVNSYPDDSLIK
jgi:hypothetical protein